MAWLQRVNSKDIESDLEKERKIEYTKGRERVKVLYPSILRPVIDRQFLRPQRFFYRVKNSSSFTSFVIHDPAE